MISYQVPKGYQQTEVGIIPEDWEVTSLGDISFVSSGGTPSRTNSAYWDGSIPWITTTQIDFNVIAAAEQLITQDGLKNSAAKLFPPGTLLMAMYGQGKTRGKVAILGIEASTNQACAAISLYDSVDHGYVFHYLISQYELIRNLSNTGNQENLNGFIIKSINITLPPIEEQRSIAQALSDVDALIAALDQLIAKKRHLKTATMQQLLTGKKRLPGFGEGKGYQQSSIGLIPEDWEVTALGDIIEYIKGFAFKSSDFQEHGVRVIRVSDTTFDSIKSGSTIFIDKKKAENFTKWALREGDLIISTVGSKPPMYDSMVGKATLVNAENVNALLNQNAVIIRSKNWSQENQVLLHNHLK
jgi:type I restriction enzyme, S subunit